jgi:dienelactone hydrolase
MLRQNRLALLMLAALLLTACGEPAPIAALPAQPTVTIAQGIERHDLRFTCGETQCAAWLYLPQIAAKPPVVVMAHGFAGTRDVALEPFARRFAQAGVAAFVFDYRHFGASGGAPRQLVDPWRQLEDWRAALAFARAVKHVDGSRLCVWGTSLGGGLALITAANDDAVRCALAQAPQIDSNLEGEATFPGVFWVIRLLLTAWSDLAYSTVSDQPLTIPAIAPAGEFGMIVDDQAFAAFKRFARRGSTYRNAIAARSIFTFDDYNPAVQAAAIKAPVLLIASRADRFAPFAAAEAFAKAHPNATLEEIDGDHFDIYASPRADRAADLAAAFLVHHLTPQ